MQRVNRIVVRRDEKIFADDKVNFLIVRERVGVPERREMEYDIDEPLVDVEARPHRRREQVLGDEVMDRILVHHLLHFLMRRRVKVDPGDVFESLAPEHEVSVAGSVIKSKLKCIFYFE